MLLFYLFYRFKTFFCIFKGFELICNLPFFGSCFIHPGINFPNLPLSPPHVSSSCFLYKTEKLSKVAKTKQTKHNTD